jgi:hypothetical protein
VYVQSFLQCLFGVYVNFLTICFVGVHIEDISRCP